MGSKWGVSREQVEKEEGQKVKAVMLHPYTYTHTQKKKIKESQRSKNIYTVNIGFWRYEFSM